MIELIRLFGKELESSSSKLDFATVNRKSLPKGYFVTPGACTEETVVYLREITLDPNSTFYRDWGDITSKDRFELLVDQLMHYASTYGTDYSGDAYISNDGAINLPPMDNIKVIDTITREEAIEKLNKMLYSSMAMKQETVNDIIAAAKGLSIDVDIDKVKNKELRMLLCVSFGLVPKNPDEFVRFLVYKATDKTLLIKSKEVINAIKLSDVRLINYITKDNIVSISSVFNRFKPLFLAFKGTSKGNARIVNKLRKLAIKYHKPKVASFWSDMFSHSLHEIRCKVDELNNFKKIALINECYARVHEGILVSKPYIIRNGKMYVTDKLNLDGAIRLTDIIDILLNSLVSSLKSKACKVKLDDNIELTMPTSEKTFIGNYPLYSSVAMDKDTIVGIYWRNEWGARDLDLSYIDAKNRNKIGWNAGFNTDKVIFSGDMTNAEPEATELLYFGHVLDLNDNGIIHVNRYNGSDNAEYNLFVAKEKVEQNNWRKGYMCDPNNILFQCHDKMDSAEKSIAIIANRRIHLASLRTGSGAVSCGSEYTTQYVEYIKDNINNHLTLRNVLEQANFEFVDNTEDADMDFSKPTKDMFMDLLG